MRSRKIDNLNKYTQKVCSTYSTCKQMLVMNCAGLLLFRMINLYRVAVCNQAYYIYICTLYRVFSNQGINSIDIFWVFIKYSHCLSACPPDYLSACLPTCLPAYLFAYLPAGLPICLPTYLSACLSAFLPTCLPAYLLAYLPVCLPICLPTYLSACLYACLSACPPSLPA